MKSFELIRFIILIYFSICSYAQQQNPAAANVPNANAIPPPVQQGQAQHQMAGQPVPGQPVAGQQAAGQQMSGQQFQGQQVPGQAQEQQVRPEQMQQQQADNRISINGPLLSDRSECQNEIRRHCSHPSLDLKNDMVVLGCLHDVALGESQVLSETCHNLIWDYKTNLTQDDRVRQAARQYCHEEITGANNYGKDMGKCAEITQKGYALSCFLDFLNVIPKNSNCGQFLYGMGRLAVHDYPIVGPFIEQCGEEIKIFKCGKLTLPSQHQKARMPHSQGATLECIIEKLVKSFKDKPDQPRISEKCQHQIMRIAELQHEDYHLDIPLYLACREDRERFCRNVPSGDRKVFECLLEHKANHEMEPKCAEELSKRAEWMGRNFRLAHPLVDGCDAELRKHNCMPGQQFASSPNYHLTLVLLCLENAQHNTQDNFSEQCRHEMLSHRKLLMTEFRLNPEVVDKCTHEIDRFCSPKGDIEAEGKTLHCLMAEAKKQHDAEMFSSECRNAIADVVKVADIVSNYKVDPVLYGSCRSLIDGVCAMDAHSHTSTLTCLMKNMDINMPKECEDRLLEVQYFISRDWYTPELETCKKDAVERCSADKNWYTQIHNTHNVPESGPFVLACLYRLAYFEENLLSPPCASSVRNVLRTRAVRVNLIPSIEEACRVALSEYCSNNVKPMEEMKCLQEHFQEREFMAKHKQCHREVDMFTKMESKDTALNVALTKVCKPVIVTYCVEYANEDMDHGGVMECLAANKGKPEMTSKCRSYVNHFELVSRRDFHFSYKFSEACKKDIKKHCSESFVNTADVIRCLSNVAFESKILGTVELEKECKRELKKEYIGQEKFNINENSVKFDDRNHMKEADPVLMETCAKDIERFKCLRGKAFEDVIECLRVNFDELKSECKMLIFERERIEAIDNRFDDELQNQCAMEIDTYCHNFEGDKVLDCLKNNKIMGRISPNCRKVVLERMHEKARDIRLNVGLFDSCKEEAKKYCPEHYNKISKESYKNNALDGALIGCLRMQFANQKKEVYLGPKCKEEIFQIIIESELDIELDPPLYRACKSTIQLDCKNSVIAKGGHEGSVLECLKLGLSQRRIENTDCVRELVRRLQESLQDISADQVLNDACSSDIQKFCSGVSPGQSRVIICLMDVLKSNWLQLSGQCSRKLTERSELWARAHKDQSMPLPGSFSEMLDIVSKHPHRTSLLTWFAAFVTVLFVIGCCCGRASKRIRRELKNR